MTEQYWDDFRRTLMLEYCEQQGVDSLRGLEQCDRYLGWEKATLNRIRLELSCSHKIEGVLLPRWSRMFRSMGEPI